mmetsp:Transcript_43884/g.78756  ORF Transcript_43884/g.78756 Transcript_43884/m.78756 type:complete len:316 (+) Transcript_43884:613-1560(+)
MLISLIRAFPSCTMLKDLIQTPSLPISVDEIKINSITVPDTYNPIDAKRISTGIQSWENNNLSSPSCDLLSLNTFRSCMALISSICKNSHTVARKKQMIPKRGSARITASANPPILSCNCTPTSTPITAKTSTNEYLDSLDSHSSADVWCSTVMGINQTINNIIFFAYGHTPENKTMTQASIFAPLSQLSCTDPTNVRLYTLYQVSMASRSKLLQLFPVASFSIVNLSDSLYAGGIVTFSKTSGKSLQALNCSTHGTRHSKHSALVLSARHINVQPLLTPHSGRDPKQIAQSSEYPCISLKHDSVHVVFVKQPPL